MTKARFWMFGLCFLFLGCATMKESSPEKTMAAKTFQTTPDKATLYLYRRPVLMWARGQVLPFTLDGITVAALRPGFFAVVKVDAGEHAITTADMDTLRIQVEAGKNYYIHQSQTLVKEVAKQVDEAQAKAEISKCNMVENLIVGDTLKSSR